MNYDFDDIDDVNMTEGNVEIGSVDLSMDDPASTTDFAHSDQQATAIEAESMMDMLHQKIDSRTQGENDATDHPDSSQIHFGAKYTDAEIDKMKTDINMAAHEVSCRKSDVELWESKVSLNNTKEHRENGDYANAESRLNEAKSKYNSALDRLHDAKTRLNNAR